MSGMLGDITVSLLVGGFALCVAVFIPLMLIVNLSQDITKREWIKFTIIELIALTILYILYWYWQVVFTNAIMGF